MTCQRTFLEFAAFWKRTEIKTNLLIVENWLDHEDDCND